MDRTNQELTQSSPLQHPNNIRHKHIRVLYLGLTPYRTYRHSGLYVYNTDSRYKYFVSRFYNFYKIIVFYGLQVSSESYVLVFYIGTRLMMARESRNM
jgi:hypothetical protein